MLSTFTLKLLEACVFIADVISQDSELEKGLNKDVRELASRGNEFSIFEVLLSENVFGS